MGNTDPQAYAGWDQDGNPMPVTAAHIAAANAARKLLGMRLIGEEPPAPSQIATTPPVGALTQTQPTATTGSGALTQTQPTTTTGSGAISGLINQLSAPTTAPPASSTLTPELASIRAKLASWGGDGLTIVKQIDSGASLPAIRNSLVQLRMTTTNPKNTQFLTPIVKEAQAALTASNAAAGLPPPPSLPDWPAHQNTWSAIGDVAAPLAGAFLAPLTGGASLGLLGTSLLAGAGAALGSGLSSYIQDREVPESLLRAGVSGVGAGLGRYFAPTIAEWLSSLGGAAAEGGAGAVATGPPTDLLGNAWADWLSPGAFGTLGTGGAAAGGGAAGGAAAGGTLGAASTGALSSFTVDPDIFITGSLIKPSYQILGALGGAGLGAALTTPFAQSLGGGTTVTDVPDHPPSQGGANPKIIKELPAPGSWTQNFVNPQTGATELWEYNPATGGWTQLFDDSLTITGTLPKTGSTIINTSTGGGALTGVTTTPNTTNTPDTTKPDTTKTDTTKTDTTKTDAAASMSALDLLKAFSLGAGVIGGIGGSGSSGGSGGSGGVVPRGAMGTVSPTFSAQLPTTSASQLGTPSQPNRTMEDWYRYGMGNEKSFFSGIPQQPSAVQQSPVAAAKGGATSKLRRSAFAARAKSDGRSDDIPAVLSDGEYVVDAETVALLGNGSNRAGARALDDLRVRVRKHKGKSLAKGKFTGAAKKPAAYIGGRA